MFKKTWQNTPVCTNYMQVMAEQALAKALAASLQTSSDTPPDLPTAHIIINLHGKKSCQDRPSCVNYRFDEDYDSFRKC